MIYYVQYDLRHQRSYEPLWAELKRLGGRRSLESAWCLERTGTSATALRNHFLQYIDHDDGLLVLEVKDWAGARLKAVPSNAAPTQHPR